jgi:hypothetical protein
MFRKMKLAPILESAGALVSYQKALALLENTIVVNDQTLPQTERLALTCRVGTIQAYTELSDAVPYQKVLHWHPSGYFRWQSVQIGTGRSSHQSCDAKRNMGDFQRFTPGCERALRIYLSESSGGHAGSTAIPGDCGCGGGYGRRQTGPSQSAQSLP